MKPPPRIRKKPARAVTPAASNKWTRAERQKLLKALLSLGEETGGDGDLDYTVLGKQVPTRPVSEIQSVVEGLKDKVISSASFHLKNKDEVVGKPIQMWTRVASAVTGTLQEPIFRAFSQMLIVSSTEPRTLRNCDPPQVPDRHVGPPQRSVWRSPSRGDTNAAPPFVVFKTPAPTLGPAKRLSVLSNVVRLPNSGIHPTRKQPSNTSGTLPAATCSSPTAVPAHAPDVDSIVKRPTQQLSEPQPSTISTSKSPSSTSSPAASLGPSPGAAPSSVRSAASHRPAATPPTSAAGFPPRSGCASKYATKNSTGAFDVNCGVDFERIYHYVSAMHEPDERPLTPMESAIVLDLLMSLPEELSLLHCTKLQKHLIQMYESLSSPASSKIGKELFEDLRDGVFARTGGGDTPGRRQNAARTSDGSGVKDGEEPGDAESQSPGASKPLPPLNPFLVPLQLLMRK